MLRVAITAPSLEPKKNISGIANHTRLLINENKNVTYQHVVVGREDNQKRNVYWVFSQFRIIFNFLKGIKSAHLVHLNIPLANLSIALNVLLIFIAWCARKKIVVHFRGGELSLRADKNVLQHCSVLIFLKLSAVVIALGNKEKEFLLEEYGIQWESKIYVLPNAVDVAELDKEEGLKKFWNDQLNLVYFGRMDFAKGLEEIAQALKLCSSKFDFHFHAVGSGPDLPMFEEMLSHSVGGKYTIHGARNKTQLLEIIRRCHIFIMPSYFEGLPNALLEAMANYLVPVLTPVGSVTEVIAPGQNGFLVPVKDPVRLAETLCMASKDREMLAKMALCGHRLMRERFSIHRYCDNLMTIYRQALS